MTTERNTTLPIEGMNCRHCVQRVKKALEGVAGVSRAEVDLDAGRATVTAEEAVTRATLAAAVADAGYEVPTAA